MNNLRNYLLFIFIFFYLIVCSSCSNTKYLAEGDSLFIGGNVDITDTFLNKSDKKKITTYLEESIRPIPNKTFLKMRVKLYFYNKAGAPKSERGVRNFVRNKLGEPPVLGRFFDVAYDEKLLQNK